MPTRQQAALTRRPPSLLAEAVAHQCQIHSRRLAELQALEPLLAHLDALRPELTARKLTIYPDCLGLRKESLGVGGPYHKVLRLQVDAMFDKTRPVRWLAAFQELGLRVVDFDKAGVYPTALLRKGPLLIRMELAASDHAALLAATADAHPDKAAVCTTDADGIPPRSVAMAPRDLAKAIRTARADGFL